MTPRSPLHSRDDDRRRGRERRSSGPAAGTAVDGRERSAPRRPPASERLDRVESRLRLLENTLRGVARLTNVSVGCPCDRCGASYLLVDDGLMTCPACGFRQSL